MACLSGKSGFQKNDYINDLKVRAGYGVTGSQASVGTTDYLASYNTSVYPFGTFERQSDSAGSSTLANPYIHWEEVAQTNIGFDASLFNSRRYVLVRCLSEGDERHAGKGVYPHHIGI